MLRTRDRRLQVPKTLKVLSISLLFDFRYVHSHQELISLPDSVGDGVKDALKCKHLGFSSSKDFLLNTGSGRCLIQVDTNQFGFVQDYTVSIAVRAYSKYHDFEVPYTLVDSLTLKNTWPPKASLLFTIKRDQEQQHMATASIAFCCSLFKEPQTILSNIVFDLRNKKGKWKNLFANCFARSNFVSGGMRLVDPSDEHLEWVVRNGLY